jgi:ATP-binding cassette subfamily B protein
MEYLNPLDSTDCGPTCLRMIAKHYGKEYSSHFLRKITSLSRQGVSLYNLGKAAEQIGFKTLVGQLSTDYLKNKIELPCILYWDKSHFVVLHKITKKKKWFSKETKCIFHLADPGIGKIKLDEETFEKYWLGVEKKGYALFLEPTPTFYNLSDEEGDNSRKSLRNAYQFLFTYFSRYKKNYAQVVVAMLVGAFISLLFPFLTQSIVDYGIQNKDIHFITLILFFQVGLFLANTFTDVIRSHLLLHIGARINISILSDFLVKLMKLPMHFFDSKMSGDIVQRINDHQRIENFITSTLLTTVFSVINLVIFTFILLSYNVSIFGVFLIGSIFSVVWTLLFMNWRKSLDYKRFREMSNTNDKLFEMVNSMPEIKLNGFERFKQWEWQEIQVRLFKIDISHLSLEQYQRIGADFFDQVKNIVITFLSAYSVIQGNMTLGMMLAVSYIVGQLNAPVKQLIGLINTFQTTKIGVERMNEVYSEDNEEKEVSTLKDYIKSKDIKKGIEMKNLSFRYGGADSNYILQNLNLFIPEGKITAIVGSSGSGKTTLLKLLLKFYSPNEGNILLNGYNLENYSSQWWREQCRSVMQEGHIFSDSIK